MSLGVEVDVAIHGASGHIVDVESRSPEHPVLRPRSFSSWNAVQQHDPLVLWNRRDRAYLHAVTRGTAASDSLESFSRRVVFDQRNQWTLIVEHADARREPGNSSRCVRRTVDWIDDRHEWTIGLDQACLFGQHAESVVEQCLDEWPVDEKVEAVLPFPFPVRSPVTCTSQCGDGGFGDVSQELLKGGDVLHGCYGSARDRIDRAYKCPQTG